MKTLGDFRRFTENLSDDTLLAKYSPAIKEYVSPTTKLKTVLINKNGNIFDDYGFEIPPGFIRTQILSVD